jgi:hypothetical protein
MEDLPAAAAAVVRRSHDAIDAENERWERAKRERAGQPFEPPAAPEPESASNRTAQFQAFDTGRAELIREGEELADAMRGLTLRESDDGVTKDLVTSVTDRWARTWIANVDEFEDYWFGGHSVAPGLPAAGSPALGTSRPHLQSPGGDSAGSERSSSG